MDTGKYKIKEPGVIVFIAFISLLTVINVFFLYKNDIIEVFAILCLIIILLYFGVKRKKAHWKLLCIGSSVYIFIKALLLPLMFVYAINHDKGIIVDEQILKNERVSELDRLDSFFSLSDTNNIMVLKALMKKNDSGLLNNLKDPSVFSTKNTVNFIDTFIIEEDREFGLMGRARSRFYIKGLSNKKIGSAFIRYPTGRYANDRSIKLVVNKAIAELENLQGKTKIRRDELTKSQITWTYSMLLPYVAFDSEVMKFQKPLAISIHGFSKLVCDALLLALISTAVFEILINKKKVN